MFRKILKIIFLWLNLLHIRFRHRPPPRSTAAEDTHIYEGEHALLAVCVWLAVYAGLQYRKVWRKLPRLRRF
jgi:hypothetical protein